MRIRARARLLLSAAALAFAFGPARAQAPEAAPPPKPQSAGGGEAAFDVLEFAVEGNSVLPRREIERSVYRFLGEMKHFTDVEAARKALEDTYQRLGYQTVFVDIPEQRVEGGVIRLRVLEGTVDRSRIAGSRYFELGRIRSRVPELATGRVPDFAQVQEQLALVNRSADLQVTPVLRAGRTPGTVDVELAAKDQLPLHGDFDLDNHASPFTTPLRLNASLRYDNLWQREHSLGLTYQVAPGHTSQTNVLYGTYLWRFAESNDIVSLYGIRSNSDLALVGSTTVLGNAKIYGARWIKPLDSRAGYVHSITLGADLKDFAQTNIDAQTGNIDPLPAIRYVPLSVSYGGSLIGTAHTEQFSLGLTTAPRGLFGNTDAKFQGRRIEGRASWLVWKWDFSSETGFGRHFGGYARFAGQETGNPLISNEQFSIGGADSVRGYRESEIPGDRGEQGQLELRFFPLGRPASPSDPHILYGLAFVDGALVRLNNPEGPQQFAHPSYHIASAGLGLRAQGWYGLRLAADAAHVLSDGGSGVNGPITVRGETRASLLLGYGF